MDQLLFNIQEGALNLIPIRIAMNMQMIDEIVKDLEDYFGCKAYTDLNPYQTNISPAFVGKGIGYILNKDSVIIKNDNEEHYNEREHILPASSSAIQVGFITHSQQAEDYRRLEDAIQSAYNAINYGYVLGAGFTYFSMSSIASEDAPPVTRAMSKIFTTLCPGTQLDFISMVEENIFDSYKVAEQVILNAFTVVAQILSTKCLLVPYQRNRTTGYIER
jgi:chaperonin GroEL (HSP60 family)